jgi:hypothetical protein
LDGRKNEDIATELILIKISSSAIMARPFDIFDSDIIIRHSVGLLGRGRRPWYGFYIHTAA